MNAFYELIVPPEFKADHAARGGRSLRRFAADLADGQLRVVCGYEPFRVSPTNFLFHVSVSVGKPFKLKPFRAPTDAEMRLVMGEWPSVLFEEDNEGSDDPCVRHLWQV